MSFYMENQMLFNGGKMHKSPKKKFILFCEKIQSLKYVFTK